MKAVDAHSDRGIAVRALARGRERSHFMRWSVIALAALVAYSWAAGEFRLDEFLSERRIENLKRFSEELKPLPLQGRPWEWSVAWTWMEQLLSRNGLPAAATTLAISIAAIALAGFGAAALALPAARTFATPEAYVPHARPPSWPRRAMWAGCVWTTRALLIFLRAIPEYIWAFLFVAIVGPSPWAAVLALALHNAGVLGKLNAEVAENLPPATLSSLRALGASRRQVAFAGILPALAPRFLLFFFYRWETCVREATVLGMLGIISLGFLIQDARARQYYDVMFALILTGSMIVLVGDLISAAAREAVRRSR